MLFLCLKVEVIGVYERVFSILMVDVVKLSK